MGDKNVAYPENTTAHGQFVQQVIRDLKALEELLAEGQMEKNNTRIGAELELNFLNENYNPYPIGTEIQQKLNLRKVVTEYARFNLEINSDPLPFKENCLSGLKQNLCEAYIKLLLEAKRNNAHILLSGIIPTLDKVDISYKALTSEPRFEALYDIRKKMQDSNYEFNIRGIDELIIRDNLMLFAGTVTSYQMHLQIPPDELVDKYNWAQMIAGPLLASATNSPLFLGKKLWHETRIALFEQSADVRNRKNEIHNEQQRVNFGDQWVQESVIELLQEDIAAHEPLLISDAAEDPFEAIARGKAPDLKAWTFFNSSVYRWNRICYGVINNQPSLRIENRILPAGPTMEDQTANTAFWLGMMQGIPDRYKNLQDKIPFDDVKQNFLKAAQLGLEVQFKWLSKKPVTADELILNELLPIAREGLTKAGVDPTESSHYLDIIEKRVTTHKTGSNWMINSYDKLLAHCQPNEALTALTAGMIERQNSDKPVHTWELAEPGEVHWKNRCKKLQQFMTTSPYKIKGDTVVDLAAHMMEWKKIGHILVEDGDGKLIGLINKDAIINFLVNTKQQQKPIRAKEIMIDNPITASPDTSLANAIHLMLDHDISCLPVVLDQRPVGIVTKHEFLGISKLLISELDQQYF